MPVKLSGNYATLVGGKVPADQLPAGSGEGGPVAAADITDATATGIALITATDAAAGRTAISACASNDARLSDARAPTAHTHTAAQISNASATGLAVLTAADAAAARTAIGAAAALGHSSAFATATTAISAATYADITGCTLTVAAGTWLVLGQVNIIAANAIVQAFVAITDGSNNVISEIAASRPASGTASLNSPFSCNVFAIITSGAQATYKLRGARGLTTHTGTWTAIDGSGFNTTNHASNNSDKGSGIFAIKIA
jgi:hypothetical protein